MNAPVKLVTRWERLIERMRLTWKTDASKSAVIEGYRVLRAHPHLLADLAERNYVLRSPPEGIGEFDAGRAMGRADAIRELLRLANTDLATLLQVQR